MLDTMLSYVSRSGITYLAIVLILARWGVLMVIQDRKIRQLGGYAAKRPHRTPFGLDVIWQVIESSIGKDRSILLWDKWLNKYGHPARPYTIELHATGERFIITTDPENLKAVLATQFEDYGKGEDFNKVWHAFLGDSIFSTDHEKWHASRQLIRPQFAKDRVSDLARLEDHIQVLFGLIGDGQEVDVKDVFLRYTLDVATEFLLGGSVDSLGNPQVQFAESFAEIQRTQMLLARLGPLGFLYPRRKFNQHIAVLNSFVKPFIDAALALPQEELEKRTKSDAGYTFLHAIAAFTRDRTVLRDQLVAVLLAARDTTAFTLTWLFAELSRHPELVTSLRAEIMQVVGPTRAPTYGDLKSMKHLSHSISETLRLFSIVPMNIRVALKDTSLPFGGGPDGLAPVGMPKGTHLGFSTQLLHTTRAFYPPTSPGFADPALFAPARWEHWQPKPWSYIPFNGGPRICIGQQFALAEVAYTVVRMLQRFARVESRMGEGVARPWSEAREGETLAQHRDRVSWDVKNEIVLSPAGPIRLAFYEE